MRVVSVLLCLWVMGCASVDEVRGDALLANGDEDGALAAWSKAMGKRPIIDWEYEHLRDKRLRVLEGKWSPIASDAIKVSEGRRGLEALEGLLQTRRDMRSGSATVPVMARMDRAVLFKLRAEDWPPPAPAQVEQRVATLLGLIRRLQAQGATKEQLEAVAARLDEAVQVPLPAATDWRQRLVVLLQWRDAFRSLGVPQKTDARLAFEFEKFATATVAPMPVASSSSALEVSVQLRRDARRLGAGAPAVAFADATLRENVDRFLEHVKTMADGGDNFGAVVALARWSAQVDAGPLQRAMADYAKAGREQALERAKAAGPTGRAFLFSSMAQALGGDASVRRTVRDALDVDRPFVFTPAVTGSCPAESAVTSSFGAGTAGRLALSVRCGAERKDSVVTRSESYKQLRTFTETEEVQTGTRYERVQVGSHQEQCSQASSLPGYTWQGLCTVADYETKAFPVYETREKQVEREVDSEYSYAVRVATWAATASGEARFTTDEGTVLTASATQSRNRSAESWSYDLPGRTASDPVKHRQKDLDKSFTADGPLRDAASGLGAALVEDLRGQWKQHRTQVALEQARAAAKAGKTDEAADLYVRAALISGAADDEVTRALASFTGGASPDVIAKLLSPGGTSVLGGESDPKFAEAAPYESTELRAVDDGWAKTAAANSRDVAVTTETYHEGIYPPNEFVDFHVGIVPGEIQPAALGANPGLMVGLEGHYSPLEWLGLRYFFAVHDELGVRFTMGIKLFKGREYDNGTNETGFAFSLDGHYALYAGLRLPWFSVMAGARVGLMHMAVGELNAGGFHFEPAARVALRFFEQKQLILEASGFFGIPGVPYKNRFALSFPLFGKEGVDVMLSVEQTNFTASDLGPDGKTRVPLGQLPVHQAGLQVGGRL